MENEKDVLFVKDKSFDSKKIDDPYILEAFIPREYNLRTPEKGLQLVNRNELRHAVGVVAARSLRYFSTNGEGFNVFRTRGTAVWWLRHIYNSFAWWKAYVVNAEGERKDMPMLYIGERFGSATRHKGNEADIVLSAFENDRCIVDEKSKGGAIFAVGYSERGGLFNSPDMYGIKTIVGNKYKGAGVNVNKGIAKNLNLMAENTLKRKNKAITLQNIHNEIMKMKVFVLDRPRHKRLVKTIKDLGAKVILVKEDDLTPTFAVMRDKVDLIFGVGGIPEAVLSGMIVERLGGEMTMRILPNEVAQDERLMEKPNNWNSFRKNEVDILRNFKIVRPCTEKEDEISWDKVLTSKDLVKGKDTVFTASIIKKTPWIKFPDGREVSGVKIDADTGDIKVHVVRIVSNKVEIVTVIYKTAIDKYRKEYEGNQQTDGKITANILIKLGKAYAEFGLFQQARDCIQKAKMLNDLSQDLLQRCNSVYEYVSGLDFLTKKSLQTPKEIIEHFEKSQLSDKEEKEGLRPRRMVKRFYEYLGDSDYHAQKYEQAIVHYRDALKYSPHELKLHRKVNTIQMKGIIKEYFDRIDRTYRELNYKETKDWDKYKLKIALEVFYDDTRFKSFSCRDPWLIFYRRTVLHGETPSCKLAILIKLLKLYKKLNRDNDSELSIFLNKEFKMNKDEIDIILSYRKVNKRFHSVGELYLVKGLGLESLLKLLLPFVKVECQNELEDSGIPLSISLVEAMERRYKNVLEELKEGYIEEAQEHSYALAEAYHYVGLALYDVGDDEGTKINYKEAIAKFSEIIDKFVGITPVNAQYRIGNLYEEMALLFEGEQANYYDKAIDAYTSIIDEQKSIKLFGFIRELTSIRIEQTKDRVKYIKEMLN
ncbi:MAG: fructose-bisphosphatase class II [Candidatus Scalinduaceae bacterium]